MANLLGLVFLSAASAAHLGGSSRLGWSLGLLVVCGVHTHGVGAGACRHGLGALALPIAHQADRARGKCPALWKGIQNRPDSVQVPMKTALTRGIELVLHTHSAADLSMDWQLFQPVVLDAGAVAIGVRAVTADFDNLIVTTP